MRFVRCFACALSLTILVGANVDGGTLWDRKLWLSAKDLDEHPLGSNRIREAWLNGYTDGAMFLSSVLKNKEAFYLLWPKGRDVEDMVPQIDRLCSKDPRKLIVDVIMEIRYGR